MSAVAVPHPDLTKRDLLPTQTPLRMLGLSGDADEDATLPDSDVLVDLYRGKEMVRAALARPFLRRVNGLLAPEGMAAFNFPRDRRTARRLRRLGQHLRLVETRLVGLNCVVHCQRLDG